MAERVRSILDDGVWAARGEATDPRPDYIGGRTNAERAENTRDLYAAIEEEALVAAAFFGSDNSTPAEITRD